MPKCLQRCRSLSEDVPHVANPSKGDSIITKRSRGYLPHWEQNNATYFVTFRLADALPKTMADEFRRRKKVLTAAM